MKKLILTIGMVSLFFLFETSLYSQSLTLTPGTLSIGPVLVGQSSPDGAHSFNVSGSGFNPFQLIYTDSQDSRFTLSLNGNPGTYVMNLTYSADVLGNVNQNIFVKYAPTTTGFVPASVMVYEFQVPSFQYKSVQGIGQGPEMLVEGRETGTDPWDEILDGETTPAVAEGTDFGDALFNIETVDRTFQITNTATGGFSGNLNLTAYEALKYVEITGTDADQFSVTAEPSTPVAPAGGTTTYTIRFEPTSAGVKTADVSIGNNDPDENPYNFTIQGTGTMTPPGAPTADAATEIDNNSFSANWTVGGGGPTEGYYLDVAENNLFTVFVPGYEYLDVGLVNTYKVTGLKDNTDYYYRVTPYDVGGPGPVSNTQSLTTAPAVPVSQPATNIDVESFYANWNFVAGATTYRLDVNTQPDFGGTAIYDDEVVTTNYKYVIGLTGGTTYYYRVRSNNGNSSENSGIVSAVTICNAPVATAATGVTDDEFTANWNVPAGGAPDFYKLDVSEESNFSTYVSGYENLTVSATTKQVTGLDENTQYFYRVRAVNVSGVSASSNIINLYTYTSSLASTWTGTTSTAWYNPGNWDNGIPGPGTDATIADVANQPVVNTDSPCNDLTVEPGAELTISNGTTLTVNGDVLLEGTSSGTASLIEYGGLNVTGSEEAQVYLEENRWHYVSAPTSNAEANIFYNIYLRYWDEAASDWSYIEDTGYDLTPGTGYSAWTDPFYLGSTTVTYTGGSFNQGNVSLPVQYSGGAGWNVVGNPYPSAIDWDDASWTKTNIDAAIYVWDGVQYLVWNGTFGDLTDGIIPAYQGFYTKTSGASPALQVADAARVHGPSPYKGSEINNLIKVIAHGNGYSDATYINFNSEATVSFDNDYDAFKLFGIDEAPQIFSIVENQNLSINVLPEYDPGMVIPLGFKMGVDAEVSFRIENLESFNFPVNIVIEDLQTGEMIEMDNQSEFTFTGTKEDEMNRFNMHFMMLFTDVENVAANMVNIYSAEKSVYVKNLSSEDLSSVSVYSITGKEVYRGELENMSINRIDLNTPSGYYIVKVVTDGSVTSQKVFIK